MKQLTILMAAGAILAAPAIAKQASQPEQTYAIAEVASVEATDFMVAAANPIAAEAGYDVLASGGTCLLYTSPSPRDRTRSRMPSSA